MRLILVDYLICKKATQWVNYDENHINFWLNKWITHHPSLDSSSMVPSQNQREIIRFLIFGPPDWKLDKISFEIPTFIKETIMSTFFPNPKIDRDLPTWELTGNGLLSTASAYSLSKIRGAKLLTLSPPGRISNGYGSYLLQKK